MYKKIASNTLTQIASKAATAFISIFLIGILTKTLPLELYGSYNKVFNYLGIFAFLADLGLYAIVIREISLGREKKQYIIGNVLTLRIILAIIVGILAIGIAYFLPAYRDLYTFSAVCVITLFTLISLINSAFLALMQSQMRVEFSLFSIIFGKLINLALVAYALLYLFEKNTSSYSAFMSIFIIATIGIALTTFLNYFYAKRICSIQLLFDRQYIQHILKISLPYGIALFLSVVYFKVDLLLLSILESPQQADISSGLYGLPMKIIEVLMVLGAFYLNSLLPTLSQAFSQKNHSQISRLFMISVKLLGSFGLLLLLLGTLFKTEIIRVIAKQEFVQSTVSAYSSVDVLSVVFAVLVFHFLSLICIYILIAVEKQSLLLKINIGVTIFNILGNIALIPYFSFYGAAYVTLLSQILLFCITFYIISRIIQIPWKGMLEFIKSIFIALILYLLFSYIFVHYSFSSDVFQLMVYAPIIMLLYIGIEYLVSQKMIREMR